MKTFILIRHKKAFLEAIVDLVRAGDPNDTTTLLAADLLRAHNIVPDQVFSSIATRCIVTTDEVLEALGLNLKINLVPKIYEGILLAEGDGLYEDHKNSVEGYENDSRVGPTIAILQAAATEIMNKMQGETIFICGHGSNYLPRIAYHLTGERNPALLTKAFEFPTAGCAIIDEEGNIIGKTWD